MSCMKTALILSLVCLFAAGAEGQVPGAGQPAGQPTVPPANPFRVLDVKAEKGQIVWSEFVTVPVQKQVVRAVKVNGIVVNEVVNVTVFETVSVSKTLELKAVRATTASGKKLDAEALAELLKEERSVVLAPGLLTDKQRKLFKDDTILLETTAP
ncbi:MAG: hypothetical protein K2V38_24075, partial [Gemmataceae bacterium]|nr:hypothetical protein [Gemmataceae bacterium]